MQALIGVSQGSERVRWGPEFGFRSIRPSGFRRRVHHSRRRFQGLENVPKSTSGLNLEAFNPRP